MTKIHEPEPVSETRASQSRPWWRVRIRWILLLAICGVMGGLFLITQSGGGTEAILRKIRGKGGVIVQNGLVGRGFLNTFGIKTNNGLFRVTLDAHIPQPTSDELQVLQGSKFLRSLFLSDGRVDDSACQLFGSLQSVNSLSLHEYNLTDEELKRVVESFSDPGKFVFLQLVNTRLTDEGLENLNKCTGLLTLNIDGSEITGKGLSHLNLSRLLRLSLQNSNVTDSGLQQISQHKLPRLMELNLEGNPVSDSGLEALQDLPALRSLGVGGTRITPQGLAKFLKERPLTMLGLRDLRWSMDDFKQLPIDPQKLTILDLSGWNISDEDLRALPTFPKLLNLDLSRTRITDEGLKELARFPSLSIIKLDGTGITIKGVKVLQTSLTLREISVGKSGVTYEDLLSLPGKGSLGRIVLNEMDLSMDQLRKLSESHPAAIIVSDDRYVLPDQ